MSSAIDPSKPQDGVPAVKADLRANLAAAKVELDHGGFAAGFTPSNYGPPASSQVLDHLAAIDAVIPSLGGGAGLTGWTDVKADHGAAGNGTTNDTTALQNALNSGAAVVYLPPGTYRITSALQVIPGTWLLGAGMDKTVIDATELPDQLDPGAISCIGTLVSLPTLANTIAEGDKDFLFSSSVAASVRQWDVIAMTDTRNMSFTNFGNNERDGHLINVLYVDGTRVVPASGLPRTLPSLRIAGGTVSNVNVARLDRRGVRLEGFRLDCRGLGHEFDDTLTHLKGKGIQLDNLADPIIQNVIVRGAPQSGVELRRCGRARLDHVIATALNRSWQDGSGQYAFAFGGVAYMMMSNCYGSGGRHAIDFGKSNNTGPLFNMISHDNLLTNCVFEGPATIEPVQPESVNNVCYSTHEASYRCHLVNSIVRGGVVLRGFGHSIVGCHVYQMKHDGGRPAFRVSAAGPRGSLVIKSNHIECHVNQWLFDLRFDLLEAVEPAGVVDISDNVIHQIHPDGTRATIRFEPTAVESGKLHIKIHDNVVISAGGTRPFVDISTTSGTFPRASILNNQLPSNLSLGTVANVSEWKAMNMIGGHLQFANLPTSSPGGTGRLWVDGGTLKIT